MPVYAGSDEEAKEDATPSRKTISEADAVDLSAMHGMQYRDAADLIWGMAISENAPSPQGMAVWSTRRGVDICPALMALLEKLGQRHAEVALEPRPGNPLRGHWSKPQIDGLTVYWHLACLCDSRAEQAILDFFHANAPKRVDEPADASESGPLLQGLGWQKTERAVDLLVRMLERDYWVRKLGLVIDCQPNELSSKENVTVVC